MAAIEKIVESMQNMKLEQERIEHYKEKVIAEMKEAKKTQVTHAGYRFKLVNQEQTEWNMQVLKAELGPKFRDYVKTIEPSWVVDEKRMIQDFPNIVGKAQRMLGVQESFIIEEIQEENKLIQEAK